MRIYINGRYLTQKITGVQRYAHEMVFALDAQLVVDKNLRDMYNFTILLPPTERLIPKYQEIETKIVGRLHGHLWEQLELPYFANDGVLINLCNCAPIVKKRQVVTIHDAAIVAVPNAYSWAYRLWYRLMYAVICKRLKTVFTVSEFSKKELNKYFGIELDKIIVSYNSVEHINPQCDEPLVLQNHGLIGKEYILAVSSKNPSKNFKLVLETAKYLPDIQFVIVGGSNSRVFKEEQNEEIMNVKYTGYVTDNELVTLYKNAKIFVYPSLYEGFGIPPLEAMVCGCSVIVSCRASLPEICGDAAWYCDVDDPMSLLKCINEVRNNYNERNNLINKGYIQIKKFSWKNEIKKIINCLDNV